jgi:hypothetical protein
MEMLAKLFRSGENPRAAQKIAHAIELRHRGRRVPVVSCRCCDGSPRPYRDRVCINEHLTLDDDRVAAFAHHRDVCKMDRGFYAATRTAI